MAFTLPMITGCMKYRAVVHIEPDGTGMITTRSEITKSALAMMQSVQQGLPGGGGEKAEGKPVSPVDKMFNAEDSKQEAASFGKGVTFVGFERYSTPLTEGGKAEYAFTNVEDIALSESVPNMTVSMGDDGEAQVGAEGADAAGAEEEDDQPFIFKLRKLDGGLSELTIIVPPTEKAPAGEDEDAQGKKANDEGNTEDEAGGMAMMMMFLRDMELSLTVECGQKIVHTNATYVDGNRITLVRLDFNQLMQDPEAIKRLDEIDPDNIREAKAQLKGFKGIQVEFENPVVVRFQ